MEGYQLLMTILLGSIFLWIGSHILERRRILNGVFFGVALGSLWAILMLMSVQKDYRYLQIVLALALLAVLLLTALASFSFVIILFTTGFELIRKEGFSIAHVLSLAFGIATLISSVVLPLFYQRIHSPNFKRILIFLSSYFTYFSFVFVIYASSALVYNFYYERPNKDFLIVLGAGLNGEEVTPLLASRIDRAIEFYHSQKEKGKKIPRFIMSGGQGPDEVISEAEAMKRYAIKQGIPEEVIFKEDRSTSTRENLLFSSQIIQEEGPSDAKVLFFSNNFHVFRASLLAKSLGLNYHGLGSRTKLYFFTSAFIREYIGYLSMNLGKHFIFASIYALIMMFSLQ